MKHSHKLEAASIKLECTRSKAELERERDALQGQIDGWDTTHIPTSHSPLSELEAGNILFVALHFRIESVSKLRIIDRSRLDLEAHTICIIEYRIHVTFSVY